MTEHTKVFRESIQAFQRFHDILTNGNRRTSDAVAKFGKDFKPKASFSRQSFINFVNSCNSHGIQEHNKRVKKFNKAIAAGKRIRGGDPSNFKPNLFKIEDSIVSYSWVRRDSRRGATASLYIDLLHNVVLYTTPLVSADLPHSAYEGRAKIADQKT